MFADTIFQWRDDAHELDLRNRCVERNFDASRPLTPIERLGLASDDAISSSDFQRESVTWYNARPNPFDPA